MLTKDDFTKYKHQSFFLKLKELVANPNTNPFTFKMVFFGGTIYKLLGFTKTTTPPEDEPASPQ